MIHFVVKQILCSLTSHPGEIKSCILQLFTVLLNDYKTRTQLPAKYVRYVCQRKCDLGGAPVFTEKHLA